jgi:hypothetical protein
VAYRFYNTANIEKDCIALTYKSLKGSEAQITYICMSKKTQNSSVSLEEWIEKTDEYIKSMMKKYPLIKIKEDDGKEEINSAKRSILSK